MECAMACRTEEEYAAFSRSKHRLTGVRTIFPAQSDESPKRIGVTFKANDSSESTSSRVLHLPTVAATYTGNDGCATAPSRCWNACRAEDNRYMRAWQAAGITPAQRLRIGGPAAYWSDRILRGETLRGMLCRRRPAPDTRTTRK